MNLDSEFSWADFETFAQTHCQGPLATRIQNVILNEHGRLLVQRNITVRDVLTFANDAKDTGRRPQGYGLRSQKLLLAYLEELCGA